MPSIKFRGFPKECVQFLSDLEAHNDRQWFKRNKGEYEKFVLDPARSFVLAMGERLSKIAPDIHAEPLVDKSIFRIHRDTRFSKDKRPFKTHLAILFWEGDAKKLESPGFYFHLDKDQLLIGGGLHTFTKDQLVTYRTWVDNEKRGTELEKTLAKSKKSFPANLEMDCYKRVPQGFPKDHPRAELLKQKGVVLGEQGKIPSAIHTGKVIEYIYRRFEKMLPLHKWLLAMTKKVPS
ncbi:MAG: DUF2461 domain-containing protein [Proteobacteria bacterium]|nr:DUF2461 domain-containing protein [Pseudomonadota bacterium]